ncbi:MAG TPA: hypothetical protein VFQ50_07520 [Flavobacterium sp.]|nr:hypothetical protein [Flavobacterium sp.]
MPHLLATLRGVKPDVIKEVLESDAAFHAEKGIYLEHLWQNADDDNEVLFLFKIDNIDKTRQLINGLHEGALKSNPHANLPTMKYLK